MKTKTVLVVEDDASIRRLLVRVLARAGFQTEEVSNGREAIDRICAAGFDAVLLDLMMPVVNGFDVLRWMRRHRPELAKKSIVITAAADRDLGEIRAGDVFAVIRKPFDLEDVGKAIASTSV